MKEIIELHRKAIFPLWDKIKREYSVKDVEDYVKETFRKGEIFGYFENNRLVGCVGIIFDKKNNSGEIRHLIVGPKFQGEGIGRKLMTSVEDYSKNKVKKLLLNVLVKNKAVSFYKKIGYTKYCYIMKKKLK